MKIGGEKVFAAPSRWVSACATSGTARASTTTIGTTGTRRNRTWEGSTAARTVRFHIRPFTIPTATATTGVHASFALHTRPPATVMATKLSNDQPASSTVGRPRQPPAHTATRCRNGARITMGISEANRTQDSDTTAAATASAANGATMAADSAATPRLLSSRVRRDGRGLPPGQARPTNAADSAPRTTIATTRPSPKVHQESW